jgi:hypothetical protein
MNTARPLSRLENLEGYRNSFMDEVLWRPYTEWVCRQHGWSGYVEILWLVVLTSVVHWAILVWIYAAGKSAKVPKEEFLYNS